MVSADKSIYVAESDSSRIRKVAPSGRITTVAGTGIAGYTDDHGAADRARLSAPYAIAIDREQNLYVGDGGNATIRKILTNGTIQTIGGNGKFRGVYRDGDMAVNTSLGEILALAVANDGTVYFAQFPENSIEKITPSGILARVAGTDRAGFNGDGIQATSAQLTRPRGLALDDAGNLFISDTENYRVRRVSRDGVISTVAGNGSANGPFPTEGVQATSVSLFPTDLSTDSLGNLYVTDMNRVLNVTTSGLLYTSAEDGLISPAGTAVDSLGAVYVPDRTTHVVTRSPQQKSDWKAWSTASVMLEEPLLRARLSLCMDATSVLRFLRQPA